MPGSPPNPDTPTSSSTTTMRNSSTKDTISSTPTVDPLSFLTTPSPPTCTSTRINFATSPLPEYTNHFALVISHLLTPLECTQLLSLAESTTTPPNTWSAAEVNIGHGLQRLIPEARNCGRIIWDTPPIASRLLSRILPHLPDEIVTLKANNVSITGYGPVKRKETWRISRLNERLRFLKYTPGMYFREHCDGSYVPPGGGEISWLTVHVYLNGDGTTTTSSSAPATPSHDNGNTETDAGAGTTVDPDDEPLIGGATRFFSPASLKNHMDICPETGACLVFQHRGLLHSGEEVEQGVKYTVRSDIMFEKIDG